MKRVNFLLAVVTMHVCASLEVRLLAVAETG